MARLSSTYRDADPFIDSVLDEGANYAPTTEPVAFVTAARAMRASEWWSEIPIYEQPEPTAGSIGFENECIGCGSALEPCQCRENCPGGQCSASCDT